MAHRRGGREARRREGGNGGGRAATVANQSTGEERGRTDMWGPVPRRRHISENHLQNQPGVIYPVLRVEGPSIPGFVVERVIRIP